MGEKISIARGDLAEISNAFKKLEGTKDKTYDIDPDVAWNLAKNETLVDRDLKIYQRKRNEIFRKHNITPGIQYGVDREVDLNNVLQEIELLDDGMTEIDGVLFVGRKDLQKKAQIPVPILSRLMPFLKE